MTSPRSQISSPLHTPNHRLKSDPIAVMMRSAGSALMILCDPCVRVGERFIGYYRHDLLLMQYYECGLCLGRSRFFSLVVILVPEVIL
jgi:hypothetical protein